MKKKNYTIRIDKEYHEIFKKLKLFYNDGTKKITDIEMITYIIENFIAYKKIKKGELINE